MSDNIKNNFEKLAAIDISKFVEKKSGLNYLSWSYAWTQISKIDAEASYKLITFDGIPYICDPLTGYMVFTEVTVFGRTLSCHLPVLNGANKAMKDAPYTYTTKYGEKSVEAVSMAEINKAIMRCLTKNIALHGLGIGLYKKEDLPDDDGGEGAQTTPTTAPPNTSVPSLPLPSPYPCCVPVDDPVDDPDTSTQYGHTDISVEKPVCPFCGKLMYVTKFPDKKTGDYYLYCSGTLSKPSTCKYSCSSNGITRTDVAGKFV